MYWFFIGYWILKTELDFYPGSNFFCHDQREHSLYIQRTLSWFQTQRHPGISQHFIHPAFYIKKSRNVCGFITFNRLQESVAEMVGYINVTKVRCRAYATKINTYIRTPCLYSSVRSIQEATAIVIISAIIKRPS